MGGGLNKQFPIVPESVTRLHTLFVLTVVAAMLPTFFFYGGFNLRFALFVASGVLYCFFGIWLYKLAYDRRSLFFLYFSVQTLLALLLIYLGYGQGLLSLTLAALGVHAGVAFPGKVSYLLAGCLTLANAVPYLLLGARAEVSLFSVIAVYGAAMLFVIIFTESLMREFQGRMEVQRLNQELALTNEKLRDTARQVAELATVNERNRLAREIHDSLGHTLTVVSVELDVAAQLVGVDAAKAVTVIRKAHGLTQQGLMDVRQSVAALRISPLTNRALPEAVRDLIAELSETGLRVTLSMTGEPSELSPQLQLAAYRAAQEALTNVQKHGGGSAARLTLDFLEEGIRLCVVNDGPLPPKAADDGGFGLVSIRERVNCLGGSLEVGPNPEGGFSFLAEIPR